MVLQKAQAKPSTIGMQDFEVFSVVLFTTYERLKRVDSEENMDNLDPAFAILIKLLGK